MLTWDEFNKLSASDWKAQAQIDSKGKYDVEQLKYNVENDFVVDVFLTQTEVPYIPTTDIQLQSGLFVDVLENSEQALNTKILKHLQSGVDSLVLNVKENVNISTLLDGIFPNMVRIVLLIDGDTNSMQNTIQQYFLKTYPEKANSLHISVQNALNLGADQKFSARLALFHSFIQKIDDNSKMTVVLELKQDFIAQISELRALRRLWEQHGLPARNLQIVSTIDLIENSDIHPMIIANYLLMSAFLGGCNIVAPKLIEDNTSVRLMINMMHIFKEESKMDLVNDPIAGAYLPEALTQQMITYCNTL